MMSRRKPATTRAQRLRWLARDIAYLPLVIPGATAAVRAVGRQSAVVSYHNVLADGFDRLHEIHNVDVETSVFTRQLEVLQSNYRIRPAAEIVDPGSERGIFLSFDDGMLNNIELVEPVLRRAGLTAMFAVCPAVVSRSIPYLWRDWLYLGLALAHEERRLSGLLREMEIELSDNLSHLSLPEVFGRLSLSLRLLPEVYSRLSCWFPSPESFAQVSYYDPMRYEAMTWEHLEQLRARGHLIASHTMSHRPLCALPDDTLAQELRGAKEAIERRLGTSGLPLVYPYGTTDLVDRRASTFAAELGHPCAFMNVQTSTQSTHSRARHGLPRTASRRQLIASVSGLHDAISIA